MSDARNIFGKGFWAVADQGLFAGANFAVNWMLARWLSEVDYGAFATAFAAFLMLSVLHTGFLTEPMLVLAPNQFQNRLKPYFTILIGGHAMVSVAGSAILAAWGILEKMSGQPQQQVFGSALLCFAAAGPFILLPWLMRRAAYSQMQPRRAAVAGFVYLLLMLSALAAVHHYQILGIGSALAIMAGSGLITGLWLAFDCTDRKSVSPQLMREIFREHWHYGKWAAITQFLGFIPGNIYYFLFSASSTLADSAGLKALNNLYNPLMQANSAICLLLLPGFVSTLGTARGKRLHYTALALLAGGPAIWWLLLGIFHSPVISFMYHGKYQQDSWLLWVLGLQGIIAGMSGVYGSLLRAQRKMRAVFLGGVVSATAAVTFGLALTIHFGMAGACWSIVLTYGLHHLTLWLFSLDAWKAVSPASLRWQNENPSAMQVLFVNRDLEFAGGVPRCLLNLARTCDRHKMAFHLASLDSPSLLMKAEFEKLDIQPAGLGSHGYLRPGLRMRKMILEHGIDSVVASSFRAYLCAKIAMLGMGRQKPALIFWLHAVQGPVRGRVRQMILRLVGPRDPMLFVSNAVRDAHLPANHPGVSQVIYNGVEDHQEKPEIQMYDISRRAEFGLPQDALVLANTGELLPLKDHATIIRATHELVRRGINAHLMLIGTGELLDNLRRIAAVGPAASNIHFLGMRCDARRLLGLADIYVHGCSVEGFGLAVVEAMLAARPVVVPRGGAVMEYIEDGKNGMVYNPGDPADLANAVMKLAANREQAVKIGSAARDYCLHAFAPQQWGQSVFAFIERVQPAAVARIRTSPAFPADAQTQPELSCAS